MNKYIESKDSKQLNKILLFDALLSGSTFLGSAGTLNVRMCVASDSSPKNAD